MTDRRWLIWNVERGMWWKPDRQGYTTLTHRAGLYSEPETREILEQANAQAPADNPEEVALPVPWSTWAQEEFSAAFLEP